MSKSPNTPSGDDQSTAQSPASSSRQDPNFAKAIAACVVFVITLPIILSIVIAFQPDREANAEVLKVTVKPTLSPGELVYQESCVTCHGPNAEGVLPLGKPLRNTAFVQNASDDDLFQILAQGRFPDHPDNTTGALMPARGARGLSDAQLYDVIQYMRDIQDPTQPVVSVDAWVIESEGPSDSATPGVKLVGQDHFVSMCSSCHGSQGQGIEGLGLPFTTSQFIKNATDNEIVMVVKMGRPIWDPANTTGVDMPPKGGNPAMSDDQLNDIIKYIRAISSED